MHGRANTLDPLRRRFERLRHYGFLKPKAFDDSVDRIMDYLEAGTNVVLEFGRYGNGPRRLHPGGQLPDAAHPSRTSSKKERWSARDGGEPPRW